MPQSHPKPIRQRTKRTMPLDVNQIPLVTLKNITLGRHYSNQESQALIPSNSKKVEDAPFAAYCLSAVFQLVKCATHGPWFICSSPRLWCPLFPCWWPTPRQQISRKSCPEVAGTGTNQFVIRVVHCLFCRYASPSDRFNAILKFAVCSTRPA